MTQSISDRTQSKIVDVITDSNSKNRLAVDSAFDENLVLTLGGTSVIKTAIYHNVGIDDVSAGTQTNDVIITLDGEIVEVKDLTQLVPEEYDYLALTYVAAGNGAGEVETVIYKAGGSGGSTVATLTLTYDGSDRVSTVTRS